MWGVAGWLEKIDLKSLSSRFQLSASEFLLYVTHARKPSVKLIDEILSVIKEANSTDIIF